MNASAKREGKKGAGREKKGAGRKKAEQAATGALGFGFTPLNYAAFALGLISIVVGYVLLDRGSVTAAPLLLVLGYAVLLPVALVLGWRSLR